MHNGSYFNTESGSSSSWYLIWVFFPISSSSLSSSFLPTTHQTDPDATVHWTRFCILTLNTYIIPSGYTISKVSVLPQFYHSFKISSMRSTSHPSRFILALIYTVQLVLTCFIFFLLDFRLLEVYFSDATQYQHRTGNITG